MTVFERADRIGGLLRYGIPDFKMEKWLIDRRMEQMAGEGVDVPHQRRTSASTSPASSCATEFDAIVLAGGATRPRDLPVPGRELSGIHFAMEFLPQQNKTVAGDASRDQILATGASASSSSAAATPAPTASARRTARAPSSVHQFELLPQAAEGRAPQLAVAELADDPPHARARTRRASIRDWSINTKRFTGDEHGNVKKLHGVRLEWRARTTAARVMEEIPGSEFELDCDLVLLALGFLGPETDRVLASSASTLDRARQRPGRTPTTRRACPACSPAATCAAASRWWCGRSGKAARPRAASTRT